MKVTVTQHAVEQYKCRMFSTITEHEINKVLELIALKGKIVHRNPSKTGMFFTACHNGLYALVRYDKDEATVVTFLGDQKYRNWHRSTKARERKAIA